jgi:hypothetical protein
MRKNKENIGYQDKSHKEGQQNNAIPAGQPNSRNNTSSVSEVMENSPEQVAGRKNQPRTERNTSNQREERKE